MFFVLFLGAGILFLGHVMKAPWQARFIMLGLLYVAVLAVQVALPDGHALREATGGSPGLWLVVGGVTTLILAYRALLMQVQVRADAAEAARAPLVRHDTFGEDELERYARHITLPEIGGAGQTRLKHARVLVIGAGGLGAPVLLYLGAAGVGQLGVIDDDEVDLSNLQRQIIHTDARQRMPKVFSAEMAVKERNPFVDFRPYKRRLTADIAEALFEDYDLIVDGSDNFETRRLVNAAAVATRTPLLAGTISAWEGQVTLYDPANGAPCMECLFPDLPAPDRAQTCSESGVIGALPGVIGSILALEAVKEITRAGEGLRGRLLLYDGLTAETRLIKVERRADCPICRNV